MMIISIPLAYSVSFNVWNARGLQIIVNKISAGEIELEKLVNAMMDSLMIASIKIAKTVIISVSPVKNHKIIAYNALAIVSTLQAVIVH
jgi:hypothetical protein